MASTTIVKDYVREHRRQSREMFVPLSHPPGHAQCDFGEALVVISGVERKAHCFVIDLEALLPLPPVAYDTCEKQAGRVSSLSLSRYRTNDYSVPVSYGHRGVLVRGYVDRVVISCGSEVIARHPRSYERDDFVFDPVHYLPLLEQKTGALDQAAPLQGWDLPEGFAPLRRLLESRMGRRGKREFVQVLRLLETFSQQEGHTAVRDAIRLGAIGFDAVKHLVLCRLEGRPPRLDLELHPYLPRVTVNTTLAGDYMTLLSGRVA